MKAVSHPLAEECAGHSSESRRLSYDPRSLHPADVEDRQFDDVSVGIDWDEIIASTQEDLRAGRYQEFRSVDYPTDEALIEALFRSMDGVMGRRRA